MQTYPARSIAPSSMINRTYAAITRGATSHPRHGAARARGALSVLDRAPLHRHLPHIPHLFLATTSSPAKTFYSANCLMAASHGVAASRAAIGSTHRRLSQQPTHSRQMPPARIHVTSSSGEAAQLWRSAILRTRLIRGLQGKPKSPMPPPRCCRHPVGWTTPFLCRSCPNRCVHYMR